MPLNFLHYILALEFGARLTAPAAGWRRRRRSEGMAQILDFTPGAACKDRTINPELCVVLVTTRNPLNIGAAARAMANFGLDDLRLVNPYDLAFREAVSAVGAAHVLQSARVFPAVADAIADCSLVVGTTAAQRRELQQPIELLESGINDLRTHTGRAALVFGSEKFGLSNDDMSFCHSL